VGDANVRQRYSNPELGVLFGLPMALVLEFAVATEGIQLTNLVRQWLCGAPRLMSAYLVVMNRGRGKSWRDLVLVLGLIVVWAVIVAFSFWTERETSASALAWMHGHRLFLAGLVAFGTSVIVSRRRALKRSEAVRSWLAALPVRPAIARWEALAIETAPAVGAVCVWTAAFGVVGAVAVVAADTSIIELATTWVTVNAGIVVGAVLSYLARGPKAMDLPPGSRYVPHRRVISAASPVPSLWALGRWPVRQMFASARPKAVARVVMPILLLMPLGSSADTAMLVIAMFAVLSAVFLLVVATISVSKVSCRWLQPLPMRVRVLARALLIRPLGVILGGSSVAAWLFWVMGVAVSQSVMRGAVLMMISACVAVGGSLGVIHRTTKGRR
jgi:hypothetical protein